MPRLRRDVLKSILQEDADVTVATAVQDPRDALAVARGDVVSVVICPDDVSDSMMDALRSIMRQTPRLLAITPDGRGVLYETRVHRRLLGSLSPKALVRAIREGVR